MRCVFTALLVSLKFTPIAAVYAKFDGDCPGNDLEAESDKSLADCATRCGELPACLGFSHEQCEPASTYPCIAACYVKSATCVPTPGGDFYFYKKVGGASYIIVDSGMGDTCADAGYADIYADKAACEAAATALDLDDKIAGVFGNDKLPSTCQTTDDVLFWNPTAGTGAVNEVCGQNNRPCICLVELDPCDDDPAIPNIDGGASNCEDTDSGSTCAFVCIGGFAPSDVATCSNGDWDVQTCVPTTCPADPNIAGIDGGNSACESTSSGATCAFDCVAGYTPSAVATCTAGVWDNISTPAAVATCDAPQAGYTQYNGPCTDGGGAAFDQGQITLAACIAGCNMVPGCTAVDYDEDGWCYDYAHTNVVSDGFPGDAYCWIKNSVGCAADPVIANIDGGNSACENTIGGSTCAFACAAGYSPSAVATCTAGAWDTQTCDLDPCAADPAIANIDGGNSACENTSSGSTCAFACVAGYSPSAVATCATGAWDAQTCDADETEPQVISLVGNEQLTASYVEENKEQLECAIAATLEACGNIIITGVEKVEQSTRRRLPANSEFKITYKLRVSDDRMTEMLYEMRGDDVKQQETERKMEENINRGVKPSEGDAGECEDECSGTMSDDITVAAYIETTAEERAKPQTMKDDISETGDTVLIVSITAFAFLCMIYLVVHCCPSIIQPCLNCLETYIHIDLGFWGRPAKVHPANLNHEIEHELLVTFRVAPSENIAEVFQLAEADNSGEVELQKVVLLKHFMTQRYRAATKLVPPLPEKHRPANQNSTNEMQSALTFFTVVGLDRFIADYTNHYLATYILEAVFPSDDGPKTFECYIGTHALEDSRQTVESTNETKSAEQKPETVAKIHKALLSLKALGNRNWSERLADRRKVGLDLMKKFDATKWEVRAAMQEVEDTDPSLGGTTPMPEAHHKRHIRARRKSVVGLGAGVEAIRNGNAAKLLRLVRAQRPEERGKFINQPDPTGKTMLFYAVQKGNTTVCQVLLSYLADPNFQSTDGSTLLHNCVMMNNRKIAAQLIYCSAEIGRANFNDELPYQIAPEADQDAWRAFLLKMQDSYERTVKRVLGTIPTLKLRGRYRLAFDKLDTDNCGCLQPEEIRPMLHNLIGEDPSQQDLDKFFRWLDKNSDGKVNFTEYLIGCVKGFQYVRHSELFRKVRMVVRSTEMFRQHVLLASQVERIARPTIHYASTTDLPRQSIPPQRVTGAIVHSATESTTASANASEDEVDLKEEETDSEEKVELVRAATLERGSQQWQDFDDIPRDWMSGSDPTASSDASV